MKFVAALFVLAASSAFAFAPVSLLPKTALSSSSVMKMAVSLDDLPGSSDPIKNFDPLNLANVGGEGTFGWLQAGEQKNGRAAMVAVTGYLLQAAGVHFPGMLSTSDNISFESLSHLSPIEQWAAVPDAGKAQIILACGFTEMITELNKPHFVKGGPLPGLVFPPVDFSGVDEETMFNKRRSELNNGRLAMIAMISFFAEYNIPGSVPLLKDIAAFHATQ